MAELNDSHLKRYLEARQNILSGNDWLSEYLSLMHDEPVFVTHYPKAAKAFYMRTDRNNNEVVENFDLLAPAGFGLGVERTVAWITGEKHIRQCIAFPRLMDKVYI